MAAQERDGGPIEEPLALLERRLISEYVQARGYTLEVLHARDDAEARRILAEASLHATTKLAEVETRSHLLKELHGEA